MEYPWAVTDDRILRERVVVGAYSGHSMLKLIVPDLEVGGALYLQTFPSPCGGQRSPPTRTLLHLLSGDTYFIRFIAGTDAGKKGCVRIRLLDVSHEQAPLAEFEWVELSETARRVELCYTHEMADAMDVRLQFDVGSSAQAAGPRRPIALCSTPLHPSIPSLTLSRSRLPPRSHRCFTLPMLSSSAAPRGVRLPLAPRTLPGRGPSTRCKHYVGRDTES